VNWIVILKRYLFIGVVGERRLLTLGILPSVISQNLREAGFKDLEVKRNTITVLAVLPLPLAYGSATKPL